MAIQQHDTMPRFNRQGLVTQANAPAQVSPGNTPGIVPGAPGQGVSPPPQKIAVGETPPTDGPAPGGELVGKDPGQTPPYRPIPVEVTDRPPTGRQPPKQIPDAEPTSIVAPFEPGTYDPQVPSYVPQEPTETGKGTTYEGKSYSGQSEADILAASQKGLIGMLEEDNPYMQLARKQGARLAESRGLGGSSLRERASQGAAIESAMPLVQQAGQLASSERQTAQQATASSQIAAMQATANSEIQASSRRLSEMQQQYELAVQSGDNAAARQLQSDIQQEQNRLTEWQTNAQVAADEATQLRDQEFREQIAEDDRTLQRDMQSLDIDYKKWLEDVTFKHQGVLQGNAQAAASYSDFTEAAMNILNNPETTSAQKQASLSALKEALDASLSVISATANIDLGQFLPPNVNNPGFVGPIENPTGVNYNPKAEPEPEVLDNQYQKPTSPGDWIWDAEIELWVDQSVNRAP